MKSKLFLSMFALTLLPVLAAAQTSIVAYSPHYSTNKKVLIAEVEYPATIVCTNSGDDSVTFIYTDGTMQSDELVIRGYWVNDIKVIKDTLFFCGRTIGLRDTMAIFGFFKFDAHFAHVDSIFIYDKFKAGEPGQSVKEFTRMTSFSNNWNPSHIACIGTCMNQDRPNPCLVDIYKSGTHWDYFGGSINNEKETLTDITYMILLNNRRYLVTSGFDNTYGRHINLRVYDPDNIFDPSGIQNMRHVFCVDYSNSNGWLNPNVLLTTVSESLLSTVSYRSAPIYSPVDRNVILVNANIHVAFYNINYLLSNSVYSMVKSLEIPIGLQARMQMNQYIRKRNQTLVFLHNHANTVIPNDNQSVFSEIDYSSLQSSGSLKAYKYTDNIMQGLSPYNGINNYVLSGYYRTNNDDLRYSMETYYTPSLCAEKVDYKYEVRENISSINEEKPFTSMIGRIIWEKPEIRKQSVATRIICEDGQAKDNE